MCCIMCTAAFSIIGCCQSVANDFKRFINLL